MIYYRELNLDRAIELRKDRDWLHQQWTRRHCRVFILRDDKSLMRWRGIDAAISEAIHLPRAEIVDLIDEFEHLVFLGCDQSGPLFALDVSTHEDDALQSCLSGREFIDLRDVAWRLDAQDAAQLAYARGLVFWNRHHRYCGLCGSPTRSEYGGHMRRCTDSSCARMHFPRTDPAVIMLIEDRSSPDRPRCLLARNSRFPNRMMSTLAGFVDPLESLEETVARESFEECGIRVDRIEYQASQPWPFPSSIMLGFRARALNLDIVVDGAEIDEAHWFEAGQLREFGEWGDGGDYYCLPRRDSIARYLVDSWMQQVPGI
ncbi:MAG: NAD(+) diphosphatase [Gammaproteobacteria bacterium]|nr:NAD(+) diphosphatase [Gammaproteobacteria bacterium]